MQKAIEVSLVSFKSWKLFTKRSFKALRSRPLLDVALDGMKIKLINRWCLSYRDSRETFQFDSFTLSKKALKEHGITDNIYYLS